jgi:hypothetical protein
VAIILIGVFPFLPKRTNSIGMQLKLIPAGEFLMGSPESYKASDGSEKPQHTVKISPMNTSSVTIQSNLRAKVGLRPRGPNYRYKSHSDSRDLATSDIQREQSVSPRLDPPRRLANTAATV